MSTADNKAIVRRWIEAIDRHDLDGVGDAVAEDAVWRVPIVPEPIVGRAAVQQLVSGFFTAFSDFRAEVIEQIAEGDRVVTHVTASGTNDGEILGMPATGKHVSWSVVHTHTIRDGELKDDYVVFDRLALMEQLQGASQPAQAPA
jgi:steroid delta-isomerase-like uncharacterized protein